LPKENKNACKKSMNQGLTLRGSSIWKRTEGISAKENGKK
jgi:hypothetical protein